MTNLEKLTGKNIFWFRRDLRLEDNCGLFHCLNENENVIPVFIFDSNILDELPARDARVEFIQNALKDIQTKLAEAGSSLVILKGDPVELYKKIKPATLYFNHDYEPYALERDRVVAESMKKAGGVAKSFKDQVIFEKDEILKDDGKPYTVYTPYSKKWKLKFKPENSEPLGSESLLDKFWKSESLPIPDLESISFKKSGIDFPAKKPSLEIISNYDQTRDYPAINGTSKMSVHLRFGTVSIRRLISIAVDTNEVFLNELIWREFFMSILWHFPHVVKGAFRPAYDLIEWENDEGKFKKWCEGKTGFPIVDAGMRELNTTGYMHNRVRMVVASFLCKNLHIDWRWGEAYFAEKLLDFELSSNNGGWQWAAGTGCDAAPYFRVFNPMRQQERFDPDGEYVKKWIPELGSESYPEPIVDYRNSKEKTLMLYKTALENDDVYTKS